MAMKSRILSMNLLPQSRWLVIDMRRLAQQKPPGGRFRGGRLVVVGLLIVAAVAGGVWAAAPDGPDSAKTKTASQPAGRPPGALEPPQPDQLPEESVWGQPVEGLSLRLRAEKKLWHGNVAPRLRVHLRYLGDRRLLTSANATLYQLEVDDVWYGANDDVSKLVEVVAPNADPFTTKEIPAELEIEADRPAKSLPVLMDSSWRTAHANELSGAQHGGSGIWLPSDLQRQPLKLAPGKHTVRLAIFALPTHAGGWPTVVRAVSNPVEIEISDEFFHGTDVSLGDPALDRALDRVYAQLRPLFKKYYPQASAGNLHRNGIYIEQAVTTFEFPYTGPPGRKHESPIQRGPKKGGILCHVSLEKGPYRGSAG
ncbi:MAG: hypothetical protein WD063_02060, partial [Pirellulales bacterium]